MNALLSKPKRVVRNFRKAHGGIETWSAEDFDVFQDLLAAAHTGPLLRLRLRAQTLLAIAYAMPLYTLSELVNAVRGTYWDRLDRYLDRVDDRCSDAEEACTRAGDWAFVKRVGDLTDRFTDAVCRMADRLAKS
ncbi:hypothetical protein [Streptomyces marianii]|uniref:Uncharacterized protein n=1 Tax=Streptomyces marianii TaxID=1817406 RepID=A0A5R9DTL0_9ACTN|nr:hypothetical protein [Streptomyces marianii]TLQ38997.1 hypothetical protein FEF34_39990 [Streptomyces marianii]